MNIIVTRFVGDDDTTLSTIHVDNKFCCFGLEDGYREVKEPGETRIPGGHYNIVVRRHGGFHSRYLQRFAEHQGMLEIHDVPGFSDVLIHVGNSDEDTEGCLLVGLGANSTKDNMSISQSVDAYKILYKAVIESAIAGELTIDIINPNLKGL